MPTLTEKEIRINTLKKNIFMFLIRTARELYKFITKKTLNFHSILPTDNYRQEQIFGNIEKVQPEEASRDPWNFHELLFGNNALG